MRSAFAAFGLALFLNCQAMAGGLSASDRAELQAAMATHIQRQLVDQRYLSFDEKSGAVLRLTPLEPHPLIFAFGEYFVLCTDFRDDSGRKVNIDFFVAKASRGYTIFETWVERRDQFRRLISSGLAKKAE